MSPSQVIRVGLGYLVLFSLQIGVWALLAPQSFYDDFPGAGRSWIAVDGPYNEHLIRDVGALNLALAAILIWAAVTLSRPLVRAVSVGALVWGLPHLAYHLFNTDTLDTNDWLASVGGLVLFVVLPIAALVAVGRLPAVTDGCADG